VMRLTNSRKLAILSIWVEVSKRAGEEITPQYIGKTWESIQSMAKKRYRDGRLPWGIIGCCEPRYPCGRILCHDCWEDKVLKRQKENNKLLGKR
jgi:hypothetical protein